MAVVPKKKHSRGRRDRRRAQHKLRPIGLVECPRCHELRMPHRVCPSCGFYRDRVVVETE